MTRQFPLAGLLRLRRLQEDQARAEYAGANARIAELVGRRDAIIEGAATAASDTDNSVALRAIAAARAAQTGLLADLRILTALADEQRGAAQAGLADAHARTLGLEKLADRHAASERAAENTAEQAVLDDLVTASWQRGEAAS